MFEGFSYLIALLLVIAAIAVVFDSPIGGLKPRFGKHAARPSKTIRIATGSALTACASLSVWMGINAKSVVLWLSS